MTNPNKTDVGQEPQTAERRLMTGRILRSAFYRGVPEVLLLCGCLLLIGATALVAYWIGPDFSLALFYLVPVATAAWWGGRTHGLLISLLAAIAWHFVNVLHAPTVATAPRLWNESVFFGFFVVTSSLLSCLRATIIRNESLARTDGLTGAASGRAFYETAHLELERSRRTGRPVTLAFLDLDDFKRFNEQKGGAAGDRLLCLVADTLRRSLRCSDVVGRLGGDEFGVLLPETDGPTAVLVLARLRQALPAKTATSGLPVTITTGAVTFLRPPEIDEVAGRVNAQLLAARKAGKGRLEHQVEVGEASPRPAPAEERRAAPRVLCNRLARIHCLGAAGPDEYALVLDLSAEGVGLYAERQLPERTLVMIEALYAPEAKPLLARVVRSAGRAGGAAHGCVLSVPLDSTELQGWISDTPFPGDTSGKQDSGGLSANTDRLSLLSEQHEFLGSASTPAS